MYCILCVSLEYDSCVSVGFQFRFFFQAEDGIRDLVRSRGLGDVYKRQGYFCPLVGFSIGKRFRNDDFRFQFFIGPDGDHRPCLLYTSDAADERSSVDLGGRRIIKKKKTSKT